MSFKHKSYSIDELQRALRSVLPTHRLMVDAPKGGGDPSERFKWIDLDGHVFLSQNPADWSERIDAQGRRWKQKPPDKAMGHFTSLERSFAQPRPVQESQETIW